jgi:hypothetical protein
MPRDTLCNHRNCDGGPCKQLTPEELTPTPADLTFAEQLVAEGWLQVSAKHKLVARLPDDFPSADDLLRPEWHNTVHGDEFRRWWAMHRRMAHRSSMARTKTLTTKQFRAFKQLNGRVA